FNSRTQPQWTKIFFWQLGGRDFDLLRDTDGGDNLSVRPAYYTLHDHIPGAAHLLPTEHDFLLPGQSLSSDAEPLSSYSREFRLFVQRNGSLAIANGIGNIVWNTATFDAGRCTLGLEPDGKLALRDLP